MKTILVTGGAGFIGSHFIKRILKRYPDYGVINFDNLTYAGNLENLSQVDKNPNYHFIKGDIANKEQVYSLFKETDIDFVVNFAAETHVDRSIEEPEVFIKTNVQGTCVLLEACMKQWKINGSDKHCRKYRNGVKLLQVSTDEVYGDLGKDGFFTESTPLAPNSPYSASKASADLLVRSYTKTYGFPANITRCSNNYGPNQFPEKFIPLIISNCIRNMEIPVYGDGLQVRDWLYVEDHCSALDTVLHNGKAGEIYNIGGNNEKTNIEVASIILDKLNLPKSLIKHVNDRPGHDWRYAIDNHKIIHHLGWVPFHSFNKGVEKTVEWYLTNADWIERVITGEYIEYYNRMYQQD